MRLLAAIALAVAWLIASPATAQEQAQERARLVVLTDIGNEPDDQMSLVRLLLYANEIELDGLIANTSVWKRDAISPEMIRQVVAAYGEVQPNLALHADGFPSGAELVSRIWAGQPGYGMAATGPDHMSDGAHAIITAADRADERPLWIALWGGGNTLAQALIHVRETRTADQLDRFVARLRVYAISDQDDAGPWLRREFPGLFMIVSPSSQDGGDYARATWTGISGDRFYRNGQGADFTTVSNEWLDANIRSVSPLGDHYPQHLFIMEGDTPSFLGLIPNGLNAALSPGWGGWGGRYVLRQPAGESRAIWTQGGDSFGRVTSADTLGAGTPDEVTSDQATIWRWREAFQHDFAARMAWTVRPFAQANHPPAPSIAGDDGLAPLRLEASVGQPLVLDAGTSHDPDGDSLTYRWFHYPEAGLGEGLNLSAITLAGDGTSRVTITPTQVCRDMWLPGLVPCQGPGVAHIILAVTDNGSPALTRYRRLILTVNPAREP